MRKLLLTGVTILIAAMAGLATAEEVVVTPDGRVFSVDMVVIDETTIPATTSIELSIQENLETTVQWIPASQNGSLNILPSIAWDQDSETLFAFWLSIHSLASSDLVFASYHDGVWSETVKIDKGAFHFRSNLAISTTNLVSYENEEGEQVSQHGLRVHAVWWDDDGARSAAHYALLTIEDGQVVSQETTVLEDLLEPDSEMFGVASSNSQLHHPSLHRNPAGDGLTVVFSSELSSSIHSFDITPVAHGVLTIPSGFRTRTEPRIAPMFDNVDNLYLAPEIILSEQDEDRMIAYIEEDSVIRYKVWEGDGWSEEKAISTSGAVSSEAAVDALHRLIDVTRTKGVLTIPSG